MNYPFVPENASTFAEQVDPIFWTLTALTVFFSALVGLLVIVFAVRYRQGNKVSRANRHHHNSLMEAIWIVVPLFLGFGMFLWASKPYVEVYDPPTNALDLTVIGKRWMWHLQHPNGVRENNTMHIPVNRAIKITLISQDVNHGFYVPEFRVKRDALPGSYNTFWFEATKTGRFHLFCTEYCGTGHSEMGGYVYVMPQDEYQRWLQNKGEEVVAAHQTLEELGAKVYAEKACGNCHDPGGLQRGPILAGLYQTKVKLRDGRTIVADDNYIRKSILEPSEDIVDTYQQLMPSYKGQLSEEEILHLIAYIKAVGRNPGLSVPSDQEKMKPAVNPGAVMGEQNTRAIPTGKEPVAPRSAPARVAQVRNGGQLR